MSLTPDDIAEATFRRELRGYAEEDVDVFLDRVHARLTEVLAESEEWRNRVERAERRAEVAESRMLESSETESVLKRTLIAAQRTADDTVEEARRTAAEALDEARAEAEHTVESARAEATHTIESAQAEARRILTDAHRRASAELEHAERVSARLGDVIEEMRRVRDEYRERVRAAVFAQLEQFEVAGELPEPPERLDELATVAVEHTTASGPVPSEPQEPIEPQAVPGLDGGAGPAASSGDAEETPAAGDGDADARARDEARPEAPHDASFDWPAGEK